MRSPYEAALAASLVAGLAVGATFAAAALITAQAMGVPTINSAGGSDLVDEFEVQGSERAGDLGSLTFPSGSPSPNSHCDTARQVLPGNIRRCVACAEGIFASEPGIWHIDQSLTGDDT